MTATEDLLQRYKEIRQRLVSPPNAVPDNGIDLKRNKGVGVNGYQKVKKQPPKPPELPKPEPVHLTSEWVLTPSLTIASTLHVTAEEFGLEEGEIMTRTRKIRISKPRQIAIYIALNSGRWSAQLISDRLRMDRKTIIHAHATISSAVNKNPYLRCRIQNIEAKLVTLYPSAFPPDHQYNLEIGTKQNHPQESVLHPVD